MLQKFLAKKKYKIFLTFGNLTVKGLLLSIEKE
jgi:hypothetical protein